MWISSEIKNEGLNWTNEDNAKEEKERQKNKEGKKREKRKKMGNYYTKEIKTNEEIIERMMKE